MIYKKMLHFSIDQELLTDETAQKAWHSNNK